MKHIYSQGPSFAPAKTGRYKFFMRHHESVPWRHTHTTLVLPLLIVTRYKKPMIEEKWLFLRHGWKFVLIYMNWRLYFGRKVISSR